MEVTRMDLHLFCARACVCVCGRARVRVCVYLLYFTRYFDANVKMRHPIYIYIATALNSVVQLHRDYVSGSGLLYLSFQYPRTESWLLAISTLSEGWRGREEIHHKLSTLHCPLFGTTARTKTLPAAIRQREIGGYTVLDICFINSLRGFLDFSASW